MAKNNKIRLVFKSKKINTMSYPNLVIINSPCGIEVSFNGKL